MEPEQYTNDINRLGFRLIYNRLSDGRRWISIHVATGRKFWPFLTFSPNIELGILDHELIRLQNSLKYYTLPTLEPFVDFLNKELSLIYETEIIILSKR